MLEWLEALGYFGAFIAPLIGVFTYYLLPWPIVIFALGGTPSFNPLLIAVLGATGAVAGTYLYYFLGVGIERILPERLKSGIEKGKKYIDRYGMIAIFFFAITPLPDEIVWIPIGIMGYDKRKAMISCWLGKFILIAAISFAGFYGLQYILDFFQ
jgi:uncharacterized membrane protein YdjX (TVP38/TMEM64 family)